MLVSMQRGRAVTVVLATLVSACASPRPASAPAALAPLAPASTAPATPPESRTEFEESVKPILVSSCMPCHFPGGKMYASMPFDDPATVASHSEGILRRIKDTEKTRALNDWLATDEAASVR
jgi:hypothetical protein